MHGDLWTSLELTDGAVDSVRPTGGRTRCWPLGWGGEWAEGQDRERRSFVCFFILYFYFFYSKSIFKSILKITLKYF